jgi:RNA polymerase sigma-70 factor (ECF subfamily)
LSSSRGAAPATENFVKGSAPDDKSSLDANQSDPPTLEAIYAERARFVWLTLQRLGVRRADLDDVCQDVFVTLQRKLPEFDQRSKIQPWLFAICAHTASNYRRLARFRLEVTTGRMSADDELNPAAPAWRRPDQEASDREQLSRAEAVLNRMSPLKRTVFVMFELEGLSCQDIADELGLPVGTVYSRLHSARKLFLAYAAKQGGK